MIGSILNLVEGAGNIIEKLEEILECAKNIVQKTDSIQQQTDFIQQQTDSIQYQASNTLQINYKKQISTRYLFAQPLKLYQFQAKYNGFIRARILASNKDFESKAYIMRSLHDYYSNSGSHNMADGSTSMNPSSLYVSPVDSIITDFAYQYRPISSVYSLASDNMIFGSNYAVKINDTIINGNIVLDTVFPVLKGEEIVFLLTNGNSASKTYTITLELYYDEVRV